VHEYAKWDPVTRFDVVSSDEPLDIGWTKFEPTTKLITFDGDAISGIDARDSSFPSNADKARFRETDPLYPLTHNTEGGQHLIIGLGGGIDIAESLLLSARKIVAVDINGALLEAMLGRYSGYTGELFSRPEVELVHSEGRAFLHRETRRFDFIHLRGVDTFAALSTGAYVLAENHLYTVEAMQDFYRHLSDNGILSFHRWFSDTRPRETLRLFGLMLEALRLEGVSHPERHVIVIRTPSLAVTLMRRVAFEPEDIDRLLAEIPNRGNYPLVYAPYREATSHSASRYFHTYADAFSRGEEALIQDAYEYDITPTTDDRPFFFSYYRLSRMLSGEVSRTGPIQGYWAYFVFAVVLACATLAVALFIALPLIVFRREGLRVRGAASATLFFTALGLGFIMIEIVLMQRFALFLGHPMYSIAIVMGSMLLFAGGGSWLSSRWRGDSRVELQLITIGVAASCVFLASPLAVWLLDSAMGMHMSIKVLLTAALIGPPSLLLGFYFPTGLRIISERSPLFIPWAWGINGGFTVVGSVLTIAMAMTFGFSRVLLIAAAIYLIGILTFNRMVAVTRSHLHEPP
jgi:hypothetical protein